MRGGRSRGGSEALLRHHAGKAMAAPSTSPTADEHQAVQRAAEPAVRRRDASSLTAR